MNTNYTQAKSWISSAISDIEIVLTALKRKYYSLVAFKSQFAIEKLNKGLLNLFGLKIEKTHSPSEIIKEYFSKAKNLTFDKKAEELILNILNWSNFFESQGTKTRYGLVQDNTLIPAEKIYSKFEDVQKFIYNLLQIIHTYLLLLETIFNINEDNFEDIKKLKKFAKKLRKWT